MTMLNEFLVELAANIAAGLIVAAIIAWFINHLFFRSDLRLDILMEEPFRGSNDRTFHVRIFNTGRRGFSSDLFWHVLIDKILQISIPDPDNQGLTSQPNYVDVRNKTYLRVVGTIPKSLHPARSWSVLQFVAHFHNNTDEFEIRWFVSTDRGIFPKAIQKYARRGEKDLIVHLPLLGKLTSKGFISVSS